METQRIIAYLILVVMLASIAWIFAAHMRRMRRRRRLGMWDRENVRIRRGSDEAGR